ncbi:unnamed protein product [Coregonus sp. 'balchen']|nr:unnamed protein product [Coregonus sp. 'balchen']
MTSDQESTVPAEPQVLLTRETWSHHLGPERQYLGRRKAREEERTRLLQASSPEGLGGKNQDALHANGLAQHVSDQLAQHTCVPNGPAKRKLQEQEKKDNVVPDNVLTGPMVRGSGVRSQGLLSPEHSHKEESAIINASTGPGMVTHTNADAHIVSMEAENSMENSVRQRMKNTMENTPKQKMKKIENLARQMENTMQNPASQRIENTVENPESHKIENTVESPVRQRIAENAVLRATWFSQNLEPGQEETEGWGTPLVGTSPTHQLYDVRAAGDYLNLVAEEEEDEEELCVVRATLGRGFRARAQSFYSICSIDADDLDTDQSQTAEHTSFIQSHIAEPTASIQSHTVEPTAIQSHSVEHTASIRSHTQ